MIGHKSSIVQRKGLVWLTGLTILYQIAYQIVVWRALKQEASDEECSMEPGRHDPSPLCMEVNLFREWKRASPVLEISERERGFVTTLASPDHNGSQYIFQAPTSSASTPSPEVMLARFESQKRKLLESHMKREEELFAKLSSHLNASVGTEDASLAASLASWSHELGDLHTHFHDDDLQGFVAELSASNKSRGLRGTPDRINPPTHAQIVERHAARVAERARITKELKEQTAALEGSLASLSKDHATWLHGFEDEVLQARKDMCAQPQHRNLKECVELLGPEEANAGVSLEADLAAANNSAEWSHMFQDMVRNTEKEMCEAPYRRNRPDCIKLLASIAREERREAHAAQQEADRRDMEKHFADMQAGLKSAADKHVVWERSFEEKVRRAHRELCSDPHHRDREDCAEFAATQAESPTASATSDDVASAEESTAWSAAFMQEVRRAEKELCEEPQRRGRADCVELLAKISEAERVDTGVQPSVHANVTGDLLERSAALVARLKEHEHDHSAWERNFEEKVHQVERELCEHPSRRHRPDCVKLMSALAKSDSEAQARDLREHNAELQEGFKKVADAHAAWEHSFEEQVRQVHIDLCSDPQRRDRKDCSEFLDSLAPQTNATDELQSLSEELGAQLKAGLAERVALKAEGEVHKGAMPKKTTSLRQRNRQLRWSDAAASWSTGGWFPGLTGSGKGQVILTKGELKSSRWAGAIPKVACITAIPYGGVRDDEMWAFLNNFYMQSFEGHTELVLVYHHKDERAERLVNKYVDGKQIKGVAAQDDGDFPSSAALRFGAWSASDDTQVVAHWDFHTKHQRDRLLLEVNALAFASRPACVLRHPSARSEGDIQVATLVGEAKWMRRHWHPLLNEQREFLEALEEDQLVQVGVLDM